VHEDLCGPITPETPSGGKYFLLLVDDKSHFMWLKVLARKNQAAAVIKEFQARAEVESGKKLGVLRTDRGDEFTSIEFAEYCASEGVRRQLNAPYSPQQNGVVERRNGTVVATTRSMLKAKGLPGWFWGEAVNTAVYILNRCPTKSVTGMTPFEAWYGKKPAIHHLKTFGCVVYVKNTTPHLNKLDDRGRKMIFVGYERGTKAYRAYDPVVRRVHITRDVVFDEDAQWDWAGSLEEHTANVHGDDILCVEMMMIGYGGQTQDPGAATSTPSAPRTPASAPASISTERATPTDVQFVSPPPNLDEGLDADHDEDAPLRFRPVDDVVGPGTPPGPIERDLGENRLLAISAEEPASLIQAKQEACWRRAMEEELQAIEDNGTWTLTDLPQGWRAIGLKWVFKVKKDEHGAVVRYKGGSL
jgi:hypothetical protein